MCFVANTFTEFALSNAMLTILETIINNNYCVICGSGVILGAHEGAVMHSQGIYRGG